MKGTGVPIPATSSAEDGGGGTVSGSVGAGSGYEEKERVLIKQEFSGTGLSVDELRALWAQFTADCVANLTFSEWLTQKPLKEPTFGCRGAEMAPADRIKCEKLLRAYLAAGKPTQKHRKEVARARQDEERRRRDVERTTQLRLQQERADCRAEQKDMEWRSAAAAEQAKKEAREKEAALQEEDAAQRRHEVCAAQARKEQEEQQKQESWRKEAEARAKWDADERAEVERRGGRRMCARSR